MKTFIIANEYKLDLNRFERYLQSVNAYKENFLGQGILEDNIPEHVARFKALEKTREIAKQNNISHTGFANYLSSVGVTDDTLFSSYFDEHIPEYVASYNKYAEAANNKKRQVLSNMLITSGFSFDGYKITKYSGYISGDDCVTMPRDNFFGTNDVSENLCGCLVKIRRQALKELKEAAFDLGCNAVIGVDFDYMIMDPHHAAALNPLQTVYEPYVICVTANGNAVVIEKTENE